jgi:hypothetical protein
MNLTCMEIHRRAKSMAVTHGVTELSEPSEVTCLPRETKAAGRHHFPASTAIQDNLGVHTEMT